MPGDGRSTKGRCAIPGLRVKDGSVNTGGSNDGEGRTVDGSPTDPGTGRQGTHPARRRPTSSAQSRQRQSEEEGPEVAGHVGAPGSGVSEGGQVARDVAQAVGRQSDGATPRASRPGGDHQVSPR